MTTIAKKNKSKDTVTVSIDSAYGSVVMDVRRPDAPDFFTWLDNKVFQYLRESSNRYVSPAEVIRVLAEVDQIKADVTHRLQL